jgi:hypothetical protein
MNNTNTTVIQTLIGKLPTTIFFEQLPDRTQALKYVQWLTTNVPETKTVNQDQLYREVISKELRIVSMKIIEIEILLMVGLNTITINDFTIDSKSLIKKLINENHDNYDLDIMYRIMAQIMTKLPKDLKERVNGRQKLEIFQKISQSINIDNKLLEKFASIDPSLNASGEISMELDNGDYNTLNKKYLAELKTYEESKGYINSNSMEYATMAQDMIDTTPTNINTTELKAQYIDNHPEFMLGQNDNTLYYFDSSSGSLSEMPLNSAQTPISLADLKTILTENKIKKNEIQGLIDTLNKTASITTPSILSSDPSSTAQPSNFFDNIGSYFTSLLSSDATATTTSVSTTTTLQAPKPPKYIEEIVNDNTDNPNYIYLSQTNNLETKFKERQKIYNNAATDFKAKQKKMSEGFTTQDETEFLKKIKNDNKNIENVALGFVTIIILVFLLVIFNSLS